MDQKQIAKQMMEFNKTAFDNTFNAMTILQDQAENLVFRFLEKAPLVPEDGKKAINDWINAFKKSREEFKATADENYKKVADYFTTLEKETPKKAGKK
jgi:hypothetical protein